MSGGWLWTFATVAGPLVLIVAIGYALLRQRRLSPREKTQQHNAVEDLYHGGDGGKQASRPSSASSPPTRH